MNSMSSTVARPSTTASTAAPSPFPRVTRDRPAGTCKSIVLDSGNVLRIRDGRGLRLTAASGVLWITEEASTSDTVLLPGETHRVTHAGLTLVLAHRASVALLETAASAGPPRRVDVAHADGAPGRRVAWGKPGRLRVRALATAVRRLIRNLLSRNPSPTTGLRAAPRKDEGLEHVDVHSRRPVLHPRHAVEWEEFLPRKARNAIARDLLFPFY